MNAFEPSRGELPRQLAPGVFWIGQCQTVTYRGRILHSYNSPYLITGDTYSILVEAGHPYDLGILDEQLDLLLMREDVAPLKYAFSTHSEPSHVAGIGRLLARFPDLIACGDTTDFDAIFPGFSDRIMPSNPGDIIDLGNADFRVVEAVFRDYAYSRWGFDERRKMLFAGDGFAYAHYHEAGQCAHVAEEATELALPEMTALFAELAFFWTKFVDIEPYIQRLDELIFEELGVEIIAPTHGLPITDPRRTMPSIREGLRLGGSQAMTGTVI